MNAYQYLLRLNEVCHFNTKEGAKIGKVSNSELRRWLKNGAVEINGWKVKDDEEMDYPIFSVILFPKKPVTLLWDFEHTPKEIKKLLIRDEYGQGDTCEEGEGTGKQSESDCFTPAPQPGTESAQAPVGTI